MEWLSCGACDAEFKVVSTSDEPVQWCPYCGTYIENDEDEADDE